MLFSLFRSKKEKRTAIATPQTFAAPNFTSESSMSISTVWACVKLIAETVSTLPLKVYERDESGNKKQVAYNHVLNQLLCVSPNRHQTPAKLFEFIAASILLRGNAYLEKHYIGNRLVALSPILPQNLEKVEMIDKVLHYTFTENKFNQIRRFTLPENKIWHLRGFGIDGLMGLNPLCVAGDVLNHAKTADRIAIATFSNGLNTSGVFNYKNGFLTKEQRKVFREELKDFTGDKNAGKVILLENGVEYQQISLNPETAQLLSSREYSVEEICRLFLVPPILIGHSSKSSSWGASIESLFTLYAMNTIRPLLVNIEQGIRKDLVVAEQRENLFAEFSIEGLLRGDMATRSASYVSAVNNGYMSPNEIRAKENLPPIDGGDKYMVQSAMINLNDVGKNYSFNKETT